MLVKLHRVQISGMADGLEVGVLKGGTAFILPNSVAALCGIDPDAIDELIKTWKVSYPAATELGQFLIRERFLSPDAPLVIEVTLKGIEQDVFPVRIAAAILEYYAFEIGIDKALVSLRSMSLLAIQHGLLPDPYR